MRNTILLLLLLCAVPALSAPVAPVTIVVGGKPVPFVVSPYIGQDGQVYVPVDIVRVMGGSYVPDPDGKTVNVTTATGNMVSMPFQFVQSRFCVALMQYADALGASATWDPNTSTLTLRAKLLLVRADETGLTVTTTYPVYYKVGKLDSGKPGTARRVFVDLYGVDLSAPPASIPSTEPDISAIRTGHVGDNVRIVLDLRRALKFTIDSPMSTSRVQVAILPIVETPSPVATPIAAAPASSPYVPRRYSAPPMAAASHRAIAPPASAVPQRPTLPPVYTPPAPSGQEAGVPSVPSVQGPNAMPPTPVSTPDDANQQPPSSLVPMPIVAPPSGTQTASIPQITDIEYKVVSPTLTEITVTVNQPAKYRWLTLTGPSPGLAFDIAGATLADSLAHELAVGSSSVKTVRPGLITTANGQFGRVLIDLASAADFSVTSATVAAGTVYTISLQTPEEIVPTSFGLKGKIVMIDPGHGGEDTGAVSPGGAYREKDFTLAIGKRLREVLARNGATVYMTREDDVLPSVSARPKMAIAVGADYFISIHCDESGSQNEHEGTTVYYHADNAISRRMAIDIVNRVAAVSGLGANGVKSDTIRFRMGFGVLRGSPMPAVLVECGYMNNDADLAKLKTDDVQEHIAEGITAGLLDFVAERAAQ